MSFVGAPEVEVHVCFLSVYDLVDVGVADGFVFEHPEYVEEFLFFHGLFEVGLDPGDPFVEGGEFFAVHAHAFEEIRWPIEEVPGDEFGFFVFEFSNGNHGISQLSKYSSEAVAVEGVIEE